jgi:imidazole glycerol-phosphate synthase subunit HisH
VKVAVVDHGMGNLRSVCKALEAVGAQVRLCADPAGPEACDGLCLPGQGIFGRCLRNLRVSGMDELIRRWIAEGRPFLGICLGLQVLFESSEEDQARGLGLLAGTVTRLQGPVRVPHIGWNQVSGRYYYFDHSYAVQPSDESLVTGWCEHGVRFAARIEVGRLLAVQFHPEKSGSRGLELLADWTARSPATDRPGRT